MWKLTKAILVVSLAFASGKCLGDWTDAGWHVWYMSTCGAGSNVVEVVNMNKLSFRELSGVCVQSLDGCVETHLLEHVKGRRILREW